MNISNEMSNYEQIVILRDKAKLFDKIVDSYFKTHVCVWAVSYTHLTLPTKRIV